MKPLIGVPLRYEHLEDGKSVLYLGEKVRRTIIKAGGIVNVLTPPQDIIYVETSLDEFPPLTDSEKKLINDNLSKCDGLFLPGGSKFTPYDRYMLEYAIEKKIPTLGVCLSMQMMSCYKEDIKLEKIESTLNHKQEDDYVLSHLVKINKDSKIYKILNKEEFMVNSFHKFHGFDNHIYKSVGYSEDNVLEAIEYPASFFNIGVQWHPEVSYEFDVNSRLIIDAFIQSAIEYKKKQNKEEIEIII